jgi:hypothetical protein
VTESALKSFSKDILLERGPLPVGEIGKMLQEMTGISTLSAYLKDKFGGLKKFLEIFPEDFLIRFHSFLLLSLVFEHEPSLTRSRHIVPTIRLILMSFFELL